MIARKTTASALVLALLASSAGPQAWQAVAQETTGRASAPVVEALGALPLTPTQTAIPVSPETVDVAAPLADLQVVAAGVLPESAVEVRQVPVIIRHVAGDEAKQTAQTARDEQEARFHETLQRLEAPTELSQLPERSAGESSRGAAASDFARQTQTGSEIPASHPEPTIQSRDSYRPEMSSRSSKTIRAKRSASVPRENRSPALPVKAAGFLTVAATALAAAGHALAPAAALAAGGHAGVLATVALTASAAVGAVAGVFLSLSALDAAYFAYAKIKGRGAKASDLKAALQMDVLAGRLDPGVAEIVKPDLSGRGLGLGYASGGNVYLRPELAFAPFLRRLVLVHELHHLKQTRERGPPPAGSLRSFVERARRDLEARLAELGPAAKLRDVKVPLIERVARQTQNSLRLGRSINVGVINPDSAELKDPAVFSAMSDGKSNVEVLETAAPQDELNKPARARHFGALVLGKPHAQLPPPGSPDAQKLELTLRQLDSLFLLATDRGANPAAFRGTEWEEKFNTLSRRGSRLDRRDKRASESFERQIREFWTTIASQRLIGTPLANLVAGLYASLENKGVAFLSFGPSDPGVTTWERLLRYWEASDGGQFRVARVDREDGSHVLVLRKLEARVGLWLRPTAGHAIKTSVGDAAANDKAQQAARAALIEAGFESHLKEFDGLGVEIKHVFGEDVGRQEIYVTIPRRNAAMIKPFVARNAIDLEQSDKNFHTHLMDMADIHNVTPLWQLGITGADGEVMIIDTSADASHEDFRLPDGRSVVEVLDIVHEGPEDWVGHGSHTTGIVASLNRIYRGIARGSRVLMAKVFGKDSPGASDGDIMGGATIGFQRGVDVISMSLGQGGWADSNLADFFSRLTFKRNGKGGFTIVVASAGNAGPFRESASQPAAGRFVRSVGAAIQAADKSGWEIPFFSSVGFSLDRRFMIPRRYLFPHGLWKGGDVTTRPGDPDVYREGVVSVKSKDRAPSPSDLPDRKRTRMSGTSMAAPGDAANQALIKKMLGKAGLLEPGSFVFENLPLAADAIAQAAYQDLKLPIQRQGTGVGDALACLRVIFGDDVSAPRLWLGRVPGLGWTLPKPRAGLVPWLERYKTLFAVEDRIYAGTEAPKAETPARFDEDGAEDADGETAGERKSQDNGAAYQKALALFHEQRKAAVPELLKALGDEAWLVRFHAALALFNVIGPGRPQAASEAEAAVQAKDLARLRQDVSLALIGKAFGDGDARVRQAALLALGEIPGRTVDQALKKAAADPRWDVALRGAVALARRGDRSGVARLAKEATLVAKPEKDQYAPDKYARYTATALLGELGAGATVEDAELLSRKVNDPLERDNIRHLAAASLFNIASDAPEAISDKVIEDLLNASGLDNLALTRTVYRFFPVAIKTKAVLERLRREPLRTTATVFVLKHKAAVEQPGALGDLVNLLARALDIPLDLPTPVPDPSGRGVPGVDPAMGAIDVLIDLPAGQSVDRYWDDSQPQAAAAGLLGAGLSADVARFEGVVKAVLPLSQAVWLSVPEHKIFAFSVAARKRGLEPRAVRPLYTLSSREDASAPQLKLDGAPAAIPDDAGLVALTTGKGASEARALAALEKLAASRPEKLGKPLVVSIEVGAPSALTRADEPSPLSRLVDRLMLRDIAVVAATGNEGPGDETLAAPADALLPILVTAAGRETGWQFYAGRSARGGRAPAWAGLVDEIALDPDAPESARIGTGVAARRSAEIVAALMRRLAQAGPLPEGWPLYLESLGRQAAEPMADRSASEVGAGLVAGPEKALSLLEQNIREPEKLKREASALSQEARRRVAAQAPPPSAPERTFWQAVRSSLSESESSAGPGSPPLAFDFAVPERQTAASQAAPVLERSRSGAWWKEAGAFHVAVTVPLYALRRAVDDPGIGKFADLAGFYRDELRPAGANLIHLLPFFAVKDESPYASESLFAVNEDYVDWSLVEEVARSPGLRERLKAPTLAERQSVDYAALRAREAAVADAAWLAFERGDLIRGTARAADFKAFLRANASWLDDYAEFSALSALLGKSSMDWTAEDVARAKADARYGPLAARKRFAQWIGYGQLREALDGVQRLGGRVLFDIPMFRGKDGVDAWKRPELFKDLRTRNPGVVNQWVHEDWGDLALWDWTRLQREGYRPALAPFEHWLSFGFDGARADALHFAYNFGNGQLASGDEPGDGYARALRSVFEPTGALPVAEAFEGKMEAAQRLGFVAIKGQWRTVSGHDDPRSADFMGRFIRAARAPSDGKSAVFVSYTLGDERGDPFPVKELRDGRSYWRWRLPLPSDTDYARRAADDRRGQLAAFAALQRGKLWSREGAARAALERAASQFVKNVNGAVEIWAASMDWFFEEWGRDTFVSLPGLLLATGRHAEARENLRRFARFEKDGLIPNRMPPGGAIEYNTVDGSLWFIQAVKKYVEASGDAAFAKEMLPTLRKIVDGYARGTGYERYNRFNRIFMDSDGLIVSPAQATWMDADPEGLDKPITPRNGKAIEINALWYAGLRYAASVEREQGDASRAYADDALADRAKASFNEKFWFVTDANRAAWGESGGALRDVVEGDPHGEAVRPNMLVAVSHGGDLLSPERRRAVVLAASRDLLTPAGLRTLSYRDSQYRESYDTSKPPLEKDQAYHQGTAWPWLMGIFVDALARVRREQGWDDARAQAEVRAVLTPLVSYLVGTAEGSLPEVFDGGRPAESLKRFSLDDEGGLAAALPAWSWQGPGGTRSQAWSVAEVLRALADLVFPPRSR